MCSSIGFVWIWTLKKKHIFACSRFFVQLVNKHFNGGHKNILYHKSLNYWLAPIRLYVSDFCMCILSIVEPIINECSIWVVKLTAKKHEDLRRENNY